MDNPLDTALGAPHPQPEPSAFASASDDRTPKSQAQPETAVQPAPETPALREGHVPIAAMLDEREKRQAAERRAKELEDWKQQQEQALTPPVQPEQVLAAQRYADNLRYSRKFAERQYGKELLDQVHQWAYERAKRDPFFNAEMAAHDDPYEAAVQAYNREQVLEAVDPSDLEAFKAWKAAQAQAAAETPAPGTQPPAAQALKPPPRSLAEASGTGALGNPAVNVGEGEAFASLFRPPTR
jgi:hypothetical protein